jgi:hypothetical protein
MAMPPFRIRTRLFVLFSVLTLGVESLLSRGRGLTPNAHRTRTACTKVGAWPGQGHADQVEAELQRDNGRGEMHLSAMLQEGDVVAYQQGAWLVDGVKIGDGTDPVLSYCQIDTMQLVWTHNCEHGVLRGLALERTGDRRTLRLTEEMIEFGPEQLVARIPCQSPLDSGNGHTIIIKSLCDIDCNDWLIEV